jgi:hypothetical protein
MVRADCAKASRNSFKEELKGMMMEEFSRKDRQKRMMWMMGRMWFIPHMISTMS